MNWYIFRAGEQKSFTMKILDKGGVLVDKSAVIVDAKLCPKCARQGQMFTNISKRNQKLVEKLE